MLVPERSGALAGWFGYAPNAAAFIRREAMSAECGSGFLPRNEKRSYPGDRAGLAAAGEDGGCGDGALALAFWQTGAASVVGCDVDPRMVARAASEAVRYAADIDYVIAAAEQLPFRDRSFDIVSIITVWHSCRNPISCFEKPAACSGREAGWSW